MFLVWVPVSCPGHFAGVLSRELDVVLLCLCLCVMHSMLKPKATHDKNVMPDMTTAWIEQPGEACLHP